MRVNAQYMVWRPKHFKIVYLFILFKTLKSLDYLNGGLDLLQNCLVGSV